MILKDDSFDMRDERSPAYLKKKSIPTSSTTVRSMILFRILCSLITFFIRYPDPNNDSSVRFGFVIVDPNIRGKGCGREMLRLGISYVKENLTATRIDLGVFENNPKAKRCYESVGFKDYGSHEFASSCGMWNCIDMELYI